MSRARLLRIGAILLALAALWWLLAATGAIRYFTDVELLRDQIERLGPLGPATIIVLMAANIVVSPLPGAPIMLAAGAAFGSSWGIVYVLIGAELGALTAFLIARLAGADVVQRWFGENAALRMIGSQWTLAGIVFVSRLVPLMSFDLVSYAAGLTPLTWWRFAIANLAGMLPMYLIMVHVGDNAVASEPASLAATIVAIILITAAAFLVAWRLHRAGIRPPDPEAVSRD